MLSFYNQVLSNGSYSTWLDSEYNTVNNSFNGTKTNQHIGVGSATSVVTITPSSASTTVDDSTIQSELASQVAAGHLAAPTVDSAGNATTYYAVFFPHGVTITQGGSSSCVAGGFCAYHGTVASSGAHSEFYYGVHPDMQSGSGCDTGCGSAATAFGNYTSVASHELTEMITDAEVGLAGNGSGPPLAWYDNTNGEIGDICNAQQGTYHACDGQTYTIQLEFSNAQNNCIAYTAPTCSTTNDFSLADSPSSLSVAAGGSGSSTVSTAVTSGSAGTVTLSVSGAPAGVTTSLSSSSVTAGASTTLNVAVAAGTAAGTSTLTITGVEGSKTHTATLSLTITAVAANDFSIADSPASVSVTAGGSASSVVSTALVSGSAQSITLSASGAPTGATVSFGSNPITTGSSSTLTIATTSATPAGSYMITINGTNGTTSHTAGLALTVTSTTGGGGLTNGGFETGNLSAWTASGASETVVNSGCHGGTYCAQLGATTPTNGDSTIAQTFTAPTGATGISFYYKESCPDTVTYDWALATLADNTAGTTTTLITKTCATVGWTNVTGALTAGHSYTLTLTSHDDNYAGDPTYTVYDDVTITTTVVGGGGITNGGFESGLTSWTATGASETAVSTGCHTGTGCARLGTTTPTNGDSSVAQTFTVPSGKTQISFWYKMTCPDTVTYDWATVTLKNNATGATTTLLAKTCATNSSYVNVTGAVTAGTSYTVTLTSHDDNYAGDPSYTLYDDVTLN
jgi:hypothetical protein